MIWHAIPTYKTSVMMNKLFRNIKENDQFRRFRGK